MVNRTRREQSAWEKELPLRASEIIGIQRSSSRWRSWHPIPKDQSASRKLFSPIPVASKPPSTPRFCPVM